MAILTTNLREFLIDVVKSDFDMNDIFGDCASFYNDVDFYGLEIDDPTVEEMERVKAICEPIMKEEMEEDEVIDLWKRSVTNHYRNSYIDEHYDLLKQEIEKGVEDSFENLTSFFADEIEEAGVNLSTLEPFKAHLDWKKDQLSIEGDLTALEAVLVEVMNGYGLFCYGGLDEFRMCCDKNQEIRIRQHLHHLETIESIYGTVYDFFHVRGLADLDRYRCLGDYEVTDEELKEAIYY